MTAPVLTEEQIETRIERTIDGLDRRLMAGRLSQAEYDREMAAINAWGEEQYRLLGASQS